MNYGKKTVRWKWKKQNITKYAAWNVRGIAHKIEELESELNEKKKIKRVAITESKTEIEGYKGNQ
jgi:ribosomal protein S6